MFTYTPFSLSATKSLCTSFIFWCMGLALLIPFSLAYSMQHPLEEEIETLDVIEITGSVVEHMPRNMIFPVPDIHTYAHLGQGINLSGPGWTLSKPILRPSRILLDHTAKSRNLHTPVRPLKTTRPAYPRRAREQGWHGRVIIRLTISADGLVQSGTIHQRSAHTLLDDQAMNAVTQWTFEPAKNGGFPMTSTVDIPIQFNFVR